MGAGQVSTSAGSFADEHSVLLWQTCAYAGDLADAADSGRRIGRAYGAMLEFLHDRFLPYLAEEERRLLPGGADDARAAQLLADHQRLRTDVATIEASRGRRLATRAADALVARLARHVGREDSWLPEPADGDRPSRSLPPVTIDRIDLTRRGTEDG